MSTDPDEEAYRILSRKIVDDSKAKAEKNWYKIADKLETILDECHFEFGNSLEYRDNNGTISHSALVDILRNRYIKIETHNLANKMAENIVRNYSDETADSWNNE